MLCWCAARNGRCAGAARERSDASACPAFSLGTSSAAAAPIAAATADAPPGDGRHDGDTGEGSKGDGEGEGEGDDAAAAAAAAAAAVAVPYFLSSLPGETKPAPFKVSCGPHLCESRALLSRWSAQDLNP